MLKTIFATLLLAASAFGQLHNGNRSWKAHQLGGVLSGPNRTYLLFINSQGPEVVPLESVVLIGDEVVMKTRNAVKTRGWVDVPNVPNVTVTLVTHADEAFHFSCFDEWFGSPSAMITAPPVAYETYYVDDNWTVHKVTTSRKKNESARSHARRHKSNLNEMFKVFPLDKQNTEKFVKAKQQGPKK